MHKLILGNVFRLAVALRGDAPVDATAAPNPLSHCVETAVAYCWWMQGVFEKPAGVICVCVVVFCVPGFSK